MPFTPFHFGPSATIGISLYKKIDVFTFVFANVIIDIEPLIVMTNHLQYSLHGYAHTYLGALLLGSLWGLTTWAFRSPIKTIMQDILKFPFDASKGKMIISGILGACFHVFMDSPLYTDIKPFYPITINPMFGLIDSSSIYTLCAILFIPAVV